MDYRREFVCRGLECTESFFPKLLQFAVSLLATAASRNGGSEFQGHLVETSAGFSKFGKSCRALWRRHAGILRTLAEQHN
jgi:hypothetical protein